MILPPSSGVPSLPVRNQVENSSKVIVPEPSASISIAHYSSSHSVI